MHFIDTVFFTVSFPFFSFFVGRLLPTFLFRVVVLLHDCATNCRKMTNVPCVVCGTLQNKQANSILFGAPMRPCFCHCPQYKHQKCTVLPSVMVVASTEPYSLIDCFTFTGAFQLFHKYIVYNISHIVE